MLDAEICVHLSLNISRRPSDYLIIQLSLEILIEKKIFLGKIIEMKKTCKSCSCATLRQFYHKSSIIQVEICSNHDSIFNIYYAIKDVDLAGFRIVLHGIIIFTAVIATLTILLILLVLRRVRRSRSCTTLLVVV